VIVLVLVRRELEVVEPGYLLSKKNDRGLNKEILTKKYEQRCPMSSKFTFRRKFVRLSPFFCRARQQNASLNLNLDELSDLVCSLRHTDDPLAQLVLALDSFFTCSSQRRERKRKETRKNSKQQQATRGDVEAANSTLKLRLW